MGEKLKSIRSRIRALAGSAVSHVHPFVLIVSCLGILLAYVTGIYVTGSFHSASRWMGAILACTSVAVVLHMPDYKTSLRMGWIRVFGTFLGALIAYIYLLVLPFTEIGMLVAVFVLEMICMLLNIYNTGSIATITLVIILLISKMSPHIDPAMNCLLRFFESAVGVGVGVGLLWLIEMWNKWRKRLLSIGRNEDGQPVDLDTMPLRWGHIRVLMTASAGQLTGAGLATLVGIIIPMLQLVRHPELSAVMQGVVGGASLVGIMIGSVVIGALSDRRGYLFFFRLCPAIILTASIFAMFADGLNSLIVSLFFMGVGIGGGYSLDADYISEIMPCRWRLFMVGVAKASSALGNILVAALGFYLLKVWKTPDHWNRLLILMALFAAGMLISRIRFGQSPGWLMAHGRREEAERAVRYFLGSDVQVGDMSRRAGRYDGPKASWLDLFRRGNARKVIFSGVPWACEGFGVYGVGVFLPVLIMSIGLGLGSAAKGSYAHIISSVELSTYINMFVLVGFVVGLLVVNRLYHVSMQTWGFLLCSAGLGLLLAGYMLHWHAWVMVAGFMIFELFLNAGPHLITYIVPPQIYVVADRGAGAGLAAAFGKLGAVTGVVVIPILLKAGGVVTVLAVTIGVQLAGALVTYFVGRGVMPPEDPSKADGAVSDSMCAVAAFPHVETAVSDDAAASQSADDSASKLTP